MDGVYVSLFNKHEKFLRILRTDRMQIENRNIAPISSIKSRIRHHFNDLIGGILRKGIRMPEPKYPRLRKI